MTDGLMALPDAVYPQQLSADELRMLPDGEIGSDDHVHVTCFVFDGNEDNTFSRPGPLPCGDQTAGTGQTAI